MLQCIILYFYMQLTNVPRDRLKLSREVLSNPGTSVIEDIQYAMCLLYEEYKTKIWPDRMWIQSLRRRSNEIATQKVCFFVFNL